MMKILKYLFVLSIVLSFGNIFADDFECQKLEGEVQLSFAPVGTCPILKKKAKQFPNLTFIGPPQCFVGKLKGFMGDEPITGKVISGLTANNLGGELLTAASAIRLYDAEDGRKLGKIFTLDSFINPTGETREYLAMVGGTRRFNGGKGHVEIQGNVFFPDAKFSGTLCVED